MKGCPLCCKWCHNPESISTKPEIGFFKRKCINCGSCAKACPSGAHVFEDGKHIFKRELCTACGKCVQACLVRALEFYGREISVQEAAAAVLEDKTFYIQSGGGSTLSGGEPLMQADFCAELFKVLKQKNIHCAIDTSGAVRWENFQKVLPYSDMFLYDVKHADDRLHREHTGISNTLIFDNLKRLSECGIPIEIRIPVIPGFNSDKESFSAIGNFLSGLENIIGVRLLPYHPARSKYEIVGHADTMPHVSVPASELLLNLKTSLINSGYQGSVFCSVS